MLRLTLALVASMVIAGCGTGPLDSTGRAPSYTMAGAPSSYLARVTAGAPQQSGFRLIPSGSHALATRDELIRRAQTSIDLKYFIFQDDPTGREFLRLLRDAANRGVRVRLLLDDLNASGMDDLLTGLTVGGNVEVRMFNPFRLRSGPVWTRFAASPFAFETLNHRMHNKLFIADGVLAVSGGRNIGDEYFSRRDAGNFIDLDVLSSGDIVLQLSSDFDMYWNSDFAVPLSQLRAPSYSEDDLRRKFIERTRTANSPADDDQNDVDAIGQSSPARQIATGTPELQWGAAESYADLPGKGNSNGDQRAYGSNIVRLGAIDHIKKARSEVFLTSPYLIPTTSGIKLLASARHNGVRVSVLTNSLASTDQPVVHAAYRRYRTLMLRDGIEIYELSPQRSTGQSQRKLFGLSVGGLHTKALVVDREELFIGSMNFDPRSDHFNTESGVAIYVPVIAAQAAQLATLAEKEAANQVKEAPDGHLEWIADNGTVVSSHDVEPEASW